MFDYVMLRNFRTVCPIFPKVAPKVAQVVQRKKVMKATQSYLKVEMPIFWIEVIDL